METFVRVIEAGSFSGAAKQLRVGQPAVSKTIAQLEDRLGVRLLLRSTHGLTPTDAGREFYEGAKRSIEDIEEAEASARGARASAAMIDRLAAGVGIAPTLPVLQTGVQTDYTIQRFCGSGHPTAGSRFTAGGDSLALGAGGRAGRNVRPDPREPGRCGL